MPVFKRQLAQRIRGTEMQNEDWWFLVFDTDRKWLFVEHQWRHDGHSEGAPHLERREYGVNEFLGEDSIPGQTELTALLMDLFDPALTPEEP